MLTRVDLSDILLMFSNDGFLIEREARNALNERGWRRPDLVRAVCSPATLVSPIDRTPDPARGDFGLLVCDSTNPRLTVTLWYISDPPPSIIVEALAWDDDGSR